MFQWESCTESLREVVPLGDQSSLMVMGDTRVGTTTAKVKCIAATVYLK